MSEELKGLLKQREDEKGRPLRSDALDGVKTVHACLLKKHEIVKQQQALMEALAPGLGPESEEPTEIVMANLFGSLMDGSSQCFLCIADFEERLERRPETVAVVCTSIRKDTITNQKTLLIYALSPFPTMDWTLCMNVFDTLKAFAKQAGCARITGYSKMNEVVRMAQTFGADTRWRLLSWEV